MFTRYCVLDVISDWTCFIIFEKYINVYIDIRLMYCQKLDNMHKISLLMFKLIKYYVIIKSNII